MRIVRQGRTSYVDLGVYAGKAKKTLRLMCIIIPILLILLLQVLEIIAEKSNQRIDAEFVKTTATVTDVDEETVLDRMHDSDHDLDYVYTYTFAYKDESGREYKADIERENEVYGADYEAGEQVVIYYNPKFPETPVFKTSEDSFVVMKTMQGILAAVGGVALLLTIVPLFMRRRKNESSGSVIAGTNLSHTDEDKTEEENNGITVI